MRVVGQERPAVAGRRCLLEHSAESLQERVPVATVPEDLPALDPPEHDVLEGPRGVNASLRGA